MASSTTPQNHTPPPLGPRARQAFDLLRNHLVQAQPAESLQAYNGKPWFDLQTLLESLATLEPEAQLDFAFALLDHLEEQGHINGERPAPRDAPTG